MYIKTYKKPKNPFEKPKNLINFVRFLGFYSSGLARSVSISVINLLNNVLNVSCEDKVDIKKVFRLGKLSTEGKKDHFS